MSRERKVHMIRLPMTGTVDYNGGPKCRTVKPGWRSLYLTRIPRLVTCKACLYHLDTERAQIYGPVSQGQLRFPKERKGCSAPGKGWKM